MHPWTEVRIQMLEKSKSKVLCYTFLVCRRRSRGAAPTKPPLAVYIILS